MKNTFVDFPSELTPSSVKSFWPQPLLTAPAGLHHVMTLSPHEKFVSLLGPAAALSDAAGSTAHAPSAAPPTREPVEFVDLGVEDVWCHAREEEEEEDDDDSDKDEAAATVQPPHDAPAVPAGALHPSLGSEAHASGGCKRCCFFPRGRCANGYECVFCHYDHDKRRRKTKRKVRAAPVGAAASQGHRGTRVAPRHAGLVQGASVAPMLMQIHGRSAASHMAMYSCAQRGFAAPQLYAMAHPVPMVAATAHFGAPRAQIAPGYFEVQHSMVPQMRYPANFQDPSRRQVLSYAEPPPPPSGSPKFANM